MAINYLRSMSAYKVGAEGGDATCQWYIGSMYYGGEGVDVDYEQALHWIEKAAVQDEPCAVGQLGVMYGSGYAVPPSMRRAREHSERAIELGNSQAIKDMQVIRKDIQEVTGGEAICLAPPPPNKHSRDLARPRATSRDLARPHATSRPRSQPRAQIAPLMDKRVEIYGSSRTDMNGKRGVATDFHTASAAYPPTKGCRWNENDQANWRYTVKVDGGGAFKVKPANVRAEGVGGGSGGGRAGAGEAKVKGKGKKGRGGRK